jgi:hypothetical protein
MRGRKMNFEPGSHSHQKYFAFDLTVIQLSLIKLIDIPIDLRAS